MPGNWFKENQSRFSGELRFDEPLSKHTYYRIGGPADLLVIPKGMEDLKLLAEGIRETGSEFFILGMGSNLLVSDAGFRGVVIKTGRLNQELTLAEDGRTLRLGASVAISSLLRRASQMGWAGLEHWTGIPGSIGGAVYMNAGTHLGETKKNIRSVEVVALTGPQAGVMQRFGGDELGFEYRKNLFVPAGSVIWAGEWEIEVSDPAKVKSVIDETLARRKSSQPIDLPSCGSVFKNPKGSHDKQGMHAWQVIDRLGLRGHRIGDAQFSEKHPNFIVNLGNAKAADVRALIDLAKLRSQSELGISLEEEVRYL